MSITISTEAKLSAHTVALRDLRARFLFQGGSQSAIELADMIDELIKRSAQLQRELALAESMYKVTLQQRNQAWAQLATGDKGQTLLPAGSITRHTDGSTRLWGLGVPPYLDTATSCEPVYTLTQAASAAPEPSRSPA